MAATISSSAICSSDTGWPIDPSFYVFVKRIGSSFSKPIKTTCAGTMMAMYQGDLSDVGLVSYDVEVNFAIKIIVGWTDEADITNYIESNTVIIIIHCLEITP
jgi:hypothetical protein